MKNVLPVMALAAGLSSLPAQTIVNTNFSNATVGSYTNGATIGGGSDPKTQVNALVSANGSVAVATQSGSNVVLITDNSASSATYGIYKNFQSDTFVASQGILQGSLTFEPLTLATGSRSYVALTLNSGLSAGPGGNTAIQIYLRENLTIQYNSGGSNVAPGVTLAAGTTYRYDITYDFTNLADQKWQFSISNVDASTVVYTSGILDTRNDINPNPTGGNDFWTLGIQGAAFVTGVSPDPYVSISGISLAAVPEPGVAGALVLGLGVMMCRRPRRA